ncbi:glutamate--cysteine ligase [Streptomyces sp. NPDC057430]|uniref:carboxylate-amine ligase n=1 Tax=Streptomyces sp. NPDC057430 TaxID=3346131 RepID=UPI00367942CB
MKSLTLGVEEEFMLVDRGSRAPVNRAPAVLRAARPALGEQVQTEYYDAQVEICTRPAAHSEDTREQLARLRRVVGAAAEAAGCLLVAAGTPAVPPAEPLTVTDTRRYQLMARRYAPPRNPAYTGLVCGCHVHVGSLRRDHALRLANHMRPWLPVLQSLAANSPFSLREDTGFDSWRAVEHARWPTVGPPPVLDERRYRDIVGALIGAGVILDDRMVYWHARPSEHVPTLEVRIADANADLDVVVLLAALVRGLAVALLPEAESHAPPPNAPYSRLLLAHRLAAAQGIGGVGLDPESGEEQPAERLVHRLVERAAPGLERAGDLTRVEDLWRRLRTNGNGAARQRAVLRQRGSLEGVVDALAAMTAGP